MENIGADDKELGLLSVQWGFCDSNRRPPHTLSCMFLPKYPRHLPTDAVLLLVYQNPSVWTTGISPELNFPMPLLSPDGSFSFLHFSRLRELTFLLWQVPPCRHTFPWKVNWSGFWTLTFSPILSLSPDLFYELACELVFISADMVKCICVCQKANKSNKEKALDLELSVVRQEILLEGMELLWAFPQYFNTSISPPFGKDYPDVVLI